MSQVKTLLTDRMFVESPRWHNDRFWFSDWGAQEVITTDVIGNHKVIVSDVKSFPFCIGFLPDGRTLLVSNKQVLRIESDGSFVPHADLTNLSSYNWNDIVVDHRGNIFVNNPELSDVTFR